MSTDPGTAREERLRAIANSTQFRGTTVGSDVHVLLSDLARLREALEIVEDQDGRVDVPALAAELAELRVEVSYLRSECMRLRGHRMSRPTFTETVAALVLHWPGFNGVCTGCGLASPCPTVEALGGGEVAG